MSRRIKAVRPGAGISKDPGMNPDQLKLLMTGTELQRSITHSYDAPLDMEPGDPKALGELWEQKTAEAKRREGSWGTHGAGVYDSIKQRGYQGEPIKLHDYDVFTNAGYMTPARGIMDGHHRVAAAAALEKEGQQVYIPVEHVAQGEDPWDKPITPSFFE